ncbi:hypothetical protein L2449_20260, partial [Mesorhizobium muleiense]|uniref:hypothetical protein n=1 Tax=Mesorhizobium muleiense TaxID=1004279 RepID=UPI001F328AF5
GTSNMKPNCLTPKSCHACAWRSVLQNKIETRLNRKRAMGIKLASRHIPSRPDKIGDKEKVADDLPPISASCSKEAARCSRLGFAGLAFHEVAIHRMTRQSALTTRRV